MGAGIRFKVTLIPIFDFDIDFAIGFDVDRQQSSYFDIEANGCIDIYCDFVSMTCSWHFAGFLGAAPARERMTENTGLPQQVMLFKNV